MEATVLPGCVPLAMCVFYCTGRSNGAHRSAAGGNSNGWAEMPDQASEQLSTEVLPQGVTATSASREQELLGQLQRTHEALQNRLMKERSQLGSAAGALEVFYWQEDLVHVSKRFL